MPLNIPFHERASALGSGELCVRNHAKAGFAPFQPSQLNFDCNTEPLRALDVWTRECDVFFIGLGNEWQVCFGSRSYWIEGVLLRD